MFNEDSEGAFGIYRSAQAADTVIPEPVTGLFLLVGLAGLAARRRRAA